MHIFLKKGDEEETMIAFESAVQLAARIRNKEISSRELTELYIERIEKYDLSLIHI